MSMSYDKEVVTKSETILNHLGKSEGGAARGVNALDHALTTRLRFNNESFSGATQQGNELVLEGNQGTVVAISTISNNSEEAPGDLRHKDIIKITVQQPGGKYYQGTAYIDHRNAELAALAETFSDANLKTAFKQYLQKAAFHAQLESLPVAPKPAG